MRTVKMLGAALIAVLALGALAVSAASAGTVLVARTAAGVIPPGTNIVGFSSDLTFTTEAGKLECSKNVLEGKLANNEASKVKGEISTESSTGEGTGFGSACKTTTPFGPAVILSTHLPWPIEFNTKGFVTVKKGKTGKVAFGSTFPAAPGEPKCTYETAKVISTFKPGKTGEPTEVESTTTEQIFKLNKKISNEACPTTGKLNGHFTEKANGEPVLTELK
jgi:hypothetical protein